MNANFDQEKIEHKRQLNRAYQEKFRREKPERWKEIHAKSRRKRYWQIKEYWTNRRSREAGVPGTVTADELKDLFHKQVGKCAYCGEMMIGKGKCFTDHISPLKLKSGETNPACINHISNIALVCPSCSTSKNNKDIGEWWITKQLGDLAQRLLEKAGV